MSRIYLDHAATTPLRLEAAAAMREGFGMWANPSSPHAEGRKARAALEDARERIKAALGWQGELIFTSGASEAAAIALQRAKAGERLVSAVEHDAVLRAAPGATFLPVTANGALDIEVLGRQLAACDSPLVAVQTINSETGNWLNCEEITGQVHAQGGLVLSDCSQSAGKFACAEMADMVVVSAHKFGGPIGIGALLVSDYAMLEATGGQERGYRRGTENVPAALGFAAAVEARDDRALQPLQSAIAALADAVRGSGGTWLSDRLHRPTPFINSIAMPGLSATAQLMRFDLQGIAVSQGSACSSGSMRPSHVLQAMALDRDLISRTIRVSFGWTTTAQEIEQFAEAWLAMACEAGELAA